MDSVLDKTDCGRKMSIYYIDVINGNPENDGLSEKKPISDYKMLNIKAGDTVLFKRNSFIRGKLNISEGQEGKPVTYSAYGEGTLPTFCGSINLNDEKLWSEESKNIWLCSSDQIDEAANFIFNKSDLCGTLKWKKEDLKEQGDFFDTCFGVSNDCKKVQMEHKTYLYSEKNPALFYSDIECAVCNNRCLANNGHDIIFKNLRFINNGLHAIAGESGSKNIKIENCGFEFIGGAVYDDKKRIRYGNAVEFWNTAKNIEINSCYFNDIYDSGVTHQGVERCSPADKFIINDNVFIKCGMAAYEQRDRMPKFASFCNNICINAGEGFSKNGVSMPRLSEIWPQPMGHHIFLWRICKATDGGLLEVKNNIFYNAKYGAAIYSIISEEAEKQIQLENNIYYTENTNLINRWHDKEYSTFDEYKVYDKNCRYEKINIKEILQDWKEKSYKQETG